MYRISVTIMWFSYIAHVCRVSCILHCEPHTWHRGGGTMNYFNHLLPGNLDVTEPSTACAMSEMIPSAMTDVNGAERWCDPRSVQCRTFPCSGVICLGPSRAVPSSIMYSEVIIEGQDVCSDVIGGSVCILHVCVARHCISGAQVYYCCGCVLLEHILNGVLGRNWRTWEGSQQYWRNPPHCLIGTDCIGKTCTSEVGGGVVT